MGEKTMQNVVFLEEFMLIYLQFWKVMETPK